MRTSAFVFLAIALPAPALLVLGACDGKGLDLGTTNASTPVTINDDVDADTFVGFAVDDVPCEVYPAARSTTDGTSYMLYLDATCGTLGIVHAALHGDSALPYPQTCGDTIQLNVNFSSETDASTLAVLEPSRPSCIVRSGPTPSAADATISFTGTAAGTGPLHRVKYVGNPILALSPGPSRPGPVTCASPSDCASDTDCDGGTSVCGCGLATPAGPRNLCLTSSTCRSDAECGAGRRCALSTPTGRTLTTGNETVDEWALGYFCTTQLDDCACPTGSTAGYSCVFSTRREHWACYGNPG